MQEQTFKVEGMTCQGCVRSVERVLTGLPGVERATVLLDRKEAQVRFDPQRVSEAELRAAIVGAGFETH